MKLQLLIEFTKRDFTERYAGSVLGAAWSFVWPIASIAIYILVFSKVMGARLPGTSSTYSYGLYLAAGILPWMAFANTVTRASTVWVEKKNLLSKVRISLPSLPLYIAISEGITLIIGLTALIGVLVIAGTVPARALMLLPFVALIQQLFAYALGFLISIFYVFVRDLREITGVVLQVWFWLTPIVYVPDIVPEYVKAWFDFNPAYLFVHAYQRILSFGESPDVNRLILLTLIAHLVLLAAYLVFKKLEPDIRDFI